MKLTPYPLGISAGVLHDSETASDIATIHPTGNREQTLANAQRLAACWNACHGLDLPPDIPAGAVANLVAAARDILNGPMEGHVRADEPDSFENRSKRLEDALAPFAGQNPAPVSPDDRRPVWSFEVDGQHVRWCGTLEQFHKDRLAYVDASQGEWETHGPNSWRFHDRTTGTRTTFRAVKQ